MIPKPQSVPPEVRREEAQERQRAEILFRFRESPAGRLIKNMMTSREKQLRVAHYVSEDPITVAGTAENKGAYTELMLWYTSLFDFKLNDNSGDQDE